VQYVLGGSSSHTDIWHFVFSFVCTVNTGGSMVLSRGLINVEEMLDFRRGARESVPMMSYAVVVLVCPRQEMNRSRSVSGLG
jgi:hypothetical protein